MEKNIQELQKPSLENLHRIIEILRAPGGCPWDREQTRSSVRRCLEEECAELLDAIDRDRPPEICDELGDLLMNTVFQCVIAEERGEFTLEDVLGSINRKMIRRHAHVFGDASAANSDEVKVLWAKIKEKEEGRKPKNSVLDSVPPALSALDTAESLQKKAAKHRFDWPDVNGVIAKIEEELAEVKEALATGKQHEVDQELGDLLFAVVNLTRFGSSAGASALLRMTNRKFRFRFEYIEKHLAEHHQTLETASLELMEQLWCEAKQLENEA